MKPYDPVLKTKYSLLKKRELKPMENPYLEEFNQLKKPNEERIRMEEFKNLPIFKEKN